VSKGGVGRSASHARWKRCYRADVKGTAASLDASDTTRMRRGAGATRVTPRAARAGSEATPPSSTEEIHAEAMLAGK
jgi:hypothetical protein